MDIEKANLIDNTRETDQQKIYLVAAVVAVVIFIFSWASGASGDVGHSVKCQLN